MPPERNPRAHRSPSKQTSAQRKLRELSKLCCQRAARVHASHVNFKLRCVGVLREQRALPLRSTGFKCIDHQKKANWPSGGVRGNWMGGAGDGERITVQPGPG